MAGMGAATPEKIGFADRVNTGGAIAGSLFAGLILLPAFGAPTALVVLGREGLPLAHAAGVSALIEDAQGVVGTEGFMLETPERSGLEPGAR